MSNGRKRVCPVEKAGSLDSRIRRWLQDPRKILGPYIEEGMTVLDLGCGPGSFSVDMAEMVGESGRVIASDLQEGMLQKLRDKIQGTELEARMTLHRCEENKIGVPENVDFILAFYLLHEVPDQDGFLEEMATMLNPGGQVLIVEPPFRVSKTEFEETVRRALNAGLSVVGRPKVLFSKAALLKKG